MSNIIKAFKGFDADLKCRDFKYELGHEYETDSADLCNCGFHAVEQPIDVLRYYPGATNGKPSRFCEVELEANNQRESGDTKRVGKRIKIGAELSIRGLVKAQIEYVKEHTTNEHTDPERATAGEHGAATAGEYGAATAGDCGAATAGDCGAATAGEYGAATAGNRGAATAGDCGAATAGNRGAATAGNRGAATAGNRGAATAGNRGAATAGDCGAATAGEHGAATAGNRGAATAGNRGAATSRGSVSVGANGVATVRGNGVKARGGLGAVLVIAIENADDWGINTWKAVVVDGEKIKAETWYTLVDGELAEVEE